MKSKIIKLEISKLFMSLLVVALASACARKEINPVSARERSLYETGLKSYYENNYAKSEQAFSSLLQEYPTTRWLSSGYYYLGLNLENQGKFADAADKYRKTVDFYQGVHTREEAEALYHLALCYDALNDDERQVLTLLQLRPGLRFLPLEVEMAEWPARLAAAYAREGLSEQAKEYSLLAESGLKKVKTSGKKDVQKWLPKTYFSMGHISENQFEIKNTRELEQFFNLLDNSQGWLLMAAQSQSQPWNTRAVTDLEKSYDKAWEYVDKLPPEGNPDPILATKKRQQEQKALASRLDTILQNLKTLTVAPPPDQPEDPVFIGLLGKIKDVQKRVDILIGQRDVQDQDITRPKKQLRKQRKK